MRAKDCKCLPEPHLVSLPIKMMNSARSPDSVMLTVEDGIATITLNKPETLNAIDLVLAQDLRRFGAQVESCEDIRVLVICGKGPSFCVGADIQMFVENLDDIGPPVRAVLDELHEFISCLRRMSKVVIMSVHGSVAGGGMSLVSQGDLCVAATNTRFTPAYNRLGLSPDMGATFGFERAVGIKRSVQAFLYEDRISAQQALEWGLINWIVPDDQLQVETMRIAKRVAANASGAIAATKRLFNKSQGQTLEAQMTEETDAIVSCMQDDAFKCAVEHFVRRRLNGSTFR